MKIFKPLLIALMIASSYTMDAQTKEIEDVSFATTMSINNQNTDTKYVCTLRDSRNEWRWRLCIEPPNRFFIKPVNQFAYALVESNDDIMTGKIQRQKKQRGPVWLTG